MLSGQDPGTATFEYLPLALPLEECWPPTLVICRFQNGPLELLRGVCVCVGGVVEREMHWRNFAQRKEFKKHAPSNVPRRNKTRQITRKLCIVPITPSALTGDS